MSSLWELHIVRCLWKCSVPESKPFYSQSTDNVIDLKYAKNNLLWRREDYLGLNWKIKITKEWKQMKHLSVIIENVVFCTPRAELWESISASNIQIFTCNGIYYKQSKTITDYFQFWCKWHLLRDTQREGGRERGQRQQADRSEVRGERGKNRKREFETLTAECERRSKRLRERAGVEEELKSFTLLKVAFQCKNTMRQIKVQ